MFIFAPFFTNTVDNIILYTYNLDMNTAILEKKRQYLAKRPTMRMDEISNEPKYKSNFLNRLNSFGDRFLYSRAYFLLLCALVYLCWLFEVEVYGVIGVIIFASIVLVMRKDTTPLIAIIFVICLLP